MTWMQERQRADGGISVRVEWRAGGGREGPRQEETFSAGSDAQNRARADGFKQMVDAAGRHWPDGWVKGEGLVRVRTEVRRLAPPSFAAVGEEYVLFSKKADAIAERDIAGAGAWARPVSTGAPVSF